MEVASNNAHCQPKGLCGSTNAVEPTATVSFDPVVSPYFRTVSVLRTAFANAMHTSDVAASCARGSATSTRSVRAGFAAACPQARGSTHRPHRTRDRERLRTVGRSLRLWRSSRGWREWRRCRAVATMRGVAYLAPPNRALSVPCQQGRTGDAARVGASPLTASA